MSRIELAVGFGRLGCFMPRFARFAGLAPGATQYLASLANRFLLPEPSSDDQLALGFTTKVSTFSPETKLDPEDAFGPS